MKRLTWKHVIFTFLMMLLLAACSTSSDENDTGNAAESDNNEGSESGFEAKPIDIAMVALYDDDEWSKDFNRGFYNTAEKYQDVTVTQTAAGYDQAKMITQLNTVIRDKPDALVIRHASQPDAIEPIIEKATAEGIPVVIASVLLPEMEGLTQVNQDDKAMAEASLEELAKGIDYEGDIVVGWIGGYASMEKRRDGLDGILEKYPDINIIAEFGTDGNNVVSDAVSRTQALLRQYPEEGQIDAIWASWDVYAIGAVQAQEILKRNVPIYGIDFSEHNRELMSKENSPWKATAAVNTGEYGAVTMRAAIMAAYGEELPSNISIPPVVITQENLPDAGEDIHQYLLSIDDSSTELAQSPIFEQLEK